MNIYHKLIKLKKYKFIILCIGFVILIAHSSSKIILLFSNDPTALTNPLVKNESLLSLFVMVVLIGPLIETIIFQFLIIEILYLFDSVKKNKIIIILASAFLFGLSHLFNTPYFIFGMILGLLFASCYILAKIRNDIYPFLFTFLVHSSYNFFVFFINEIL